MEEKKYNLTKKELNAEKTKAISKFASVASHDLKNVLGGLQNITYYFTKVFKVEGETPNKMLNLLASEIKKLNVKVSEILDMTRVKQLNKESCDLFNIVSKAVEENKNEGISFELELSNVSIHADSERMKQVFSNIIKNAVDAMQNKGVVSIKMVKDNDFVEVIVSDNGIGMDDETLENCFDPMFSTKTAKAVGMGLTVALQIVEMHGGTISAQSSKGNGCKMSVRLPIIK